MSDKDSVFVSLNNNVGAFCLTTHQQFSETSQLVSRWTKCLSQHNPKSSGTGLWPETATLLPNRSHFLLSRTRDITKAASPRMLRTGQASRAEWVILKVCMWNLFKKKRQSALHFLSTYGSRATCGALPSQQGSVIISCHYLLLVTFWYLARFY